MVNPLVKSSGNDKSSVVADWDRVPSGTFEVGKLQKGLSNSTLTGLDCASSFWQEVKLTRVKANMDSNNRIFLIVLLF